jgi:hypothetical protein
MFVSVSHVSSLAGKALPLHVAMPGRGGQW